MKFTMLLLIESDRSFCRYRKASCFASLGSSLWSCFCFLSVSFVLRNLCSGTCRACQFHNSQFSHNNIGQHNKVTIFHIRIYNCRSVKSQCSQVPHTLLWFGEILYSSIFVEDSLRWADITTWHPEQHDIPVNSLSFMRVYHISL